MNPRTLITGIMAALLFLTAARAEASAPADSVDFASHQASSAAVGDTLPAAFTPYRFKPVQIIAPAALLTVGIAGIYTFDGLKRSVNHALAAPRGRRTDADNYLEFLTPAAYLTVGFIPGVKTRGQFRDRLMAGVTAYAVMTVVDNVMKASFREVRPDGFARNSFPSGHTSVAFTGAELMRIEYGPAIGFAGYAAACTVGFLRLYNNRHWVNDVLGGAAVGILSARIAYWLLPLERRLFGLDRPGSPTLTVLPLAGNANGLALTLTF